MAGRGEVIQFHDIFPVKAANIENFHSCSPFPLSASELCRMKLCGCAVQLYVALKRQIIDGKYDVK